MKDGSDHEPWWVAPVLILGMPIIMLIAGCISIKLVFSACIKHLREWAKGAD